MRANTHQRTMTARERKVLEQSFKVHPFIPENISVKVTKDVFSAIFYFVAIGSVDLCC